MPAMQTNNVASLQLYSMSTRVHTHTYNRFTALWILSGTTRVSLYQKNIHTLTPILIINRHLSASSIYCNPQHPFCSIYVPDSLFGQPLSKSSLVYLLVWHPPLHTPNISSPNHCLLIVLPPLLPFYSPPGLCPGLPR